VAGSPIVPLRSGARAGTFFEGTDLSIPSPSAGPETLPRSTAPEERESRLRTLIRLQEPYTYSVPNLRLRWSRDARKEMLTESRSLGRIAMVVIVTLGMVTTAFLAMAPPTPAAVVASAAQGHLRTTASGQATVDLRSASTYAAIAYASVTSTGATALTGDLGVSPGSAVTGFPPGTCSGTKNIANSAAATAMADVTTAYNDAAGRTTGAISVSGNLGGQTLTPGLYKSTSTLAISSGDLTLSGAGVYIFQMTSGFTTTSGRAVILSNGATAGSVFWQVGSTASIGTTSTVQGIILAYASVTLDTGAHLNGAALARTGDVTLAGATIVVPSTGGGGGGGGGGSGAGGGASGLGTVPSWGWVAIGVGAVAIVAGVAAAMAMRRRGKQPN
jgi:hypothetical protein